MLVLCFGEAVSVELGPLNGPLYSQLFISATAANGKYWEFQHAIFGYLDY
jgi:hypothetical protein